MQNFTAAAIAATGLRAADFRRYDPARFIEDPSSNPNFGQPFQLGLGYFRRFSAGSTGLTNNFSSTVAFTDVEFRINSAVPEPATWAMMIIGFGGVGAALRRRPEGIRAALRA